MTISHDFTAAIYSVRTTEVYGEFITSFTNTTVTIEMPDTETGFLMGEGGRVMPLGNNQMRYATTNYGADSFILTAGNPMWLIRTTDLEGEVRLLLAVTHYLYDAQGMVLGHDVVYVVVEGAPLPEFGSAGSFEFWRGLTQWDIDPSDTHPEGLVVAWESFDIDPVIVGTPGNDRLEGSAGNDEIQGGDGADTLIGGDGADTIFGGDTTADLRDLVYGGGGNDTIDGGYGNDELRGDDGNDAIEGYFGSDTLIGGTGNDTLSGSALSDQIFGGDGNDFLNGGFGHDRMNGGAGADRFYHLGIANHGSDWVQDYNAADGDRLVFGNAAATRTQFQINYGTTVGAGDAAVQEAFVVYRPTGQVIWALVDGAGQDHIYLQIGAVSYDLMA